MGSLSCLRRLLGTKLSVSASAIPLAIVANCFGFAPIWVFTFSLVGLPLLAGSVKFLTEQVALSTGPIVGGLLNAAFSNVLELTIAIFALHNHKIDVLKHFLLGSIISNLLLVLGASLYHGGIVKLQHLQKYDETQAIMNSYMLLLALLCHLLPMPFKNVAASSAQIEDLSLPLSIAASMTLLILYSGKLVFDLREANNQSSETIEETKVIGLCSGILWLVLSIGLTILLSKYVVETIEDASDASVFSVKFLSVTLLPTVANVARHNGAITSAFKDKELDISLSIALGSATQTSTFVVPLCVAVAWLMDIKMDLNFNLEQIGVLTLTIAATTFPLQGWLPSFGRDSSGSISWKYSSSSFKLRFGRRSQNLCC